MFGMFGSGWVEGLLLVGDLVVLEGLALVLFSCFLSLFVGLVLSLSLALVLWRVVDCGCSLGVGTRGLEEVTNEV